MIVALTHSDQQTHYRYVDGPGTYDFPSHQRLTISSYPTGKATLFGLSHVVEFLLEDLDEDPLTYLDAGEEYVLHIVPGEVFAKSQSSVEGNGAYALAKYLIRHSRRDVMGALPRLYASLKDDPRLPLLTADCYAYGALGNPLDPRKSFYETLSLYLSFPEASNQLGRYVRHGLGVEAKPLLKEFGEGEFIYYASVFGVDASDARLRDPSQIPGMLTYLPYYLPHLLRRLKLDPNYIQEPEFYDGKCLQTAELISLVVYHRHATFFSSWDQSKTVEMAEAGIRDFAGARETMLHYAKEGHLEADFALLCFPLCYGLDKDDLTLAECCLRILDAEETPISLLYQCLLYHYGVHVDKDEEKAEALAKKLSEISPVILAFFF